MINNLVEVTLCDGKMIAENEQKGDILIIISFSKKRFLSYLVQNLHVFYEVSTILLLGVNNFVVSDYVCF
jgi:hypothetical protein